VSPQRPPDFEPLAPADPVPGDRDEVAAIARRYRDTAAEIAQQAANLNKLAQQAVGGWKGKAGSAFHEHATDLAGRISKAQSRYAVTGDALAGWAGPLGEHQDSVYQAVWQAKAAQQQLTANAPSPPPPSGSPSPPPPPTAAEQQQERTRSASYDNAQASMTAARNQFNTAVSDYHADAARAADKIHHVIGHDGLKDSWWDRNFGWISTVMHIVAIIVIVLAIVLIVLACPLSAGFLAAFLGMSAATLATATTVLECVLVGLTVLQLAFDTTAALTDKGSWTAAILDLVALCTFGFGKLAEAGIRGLAESGLGVGEAVQAGRAGRAVMSSNGLPGILYSLGSRSEFARTLIGFAGKGGILDEAISTADGAKTALATAVKAAEGGNLPALWTMSGDIAESLAKLDTVATKVPGVLRVDIPKIAATGFAVLDGYAQWGTFISTGSYNMWTWAQGG
jgi:uncharacterized protein YukE